MLASTSFRKSTQVCMQQSWKACLHPARGIVTHLTDIHVALHDGVEGGLVNACRLHAHQVGLEQHLRAPEPLVADGDHLYKRVIRGELEALALQAAGQLVSLARGLYRMPEPCRRLKLVKYCWKPPQRGRDLRYICSSAELFNRCMIAVHSSQIMCQL